MFTISRARTPREASRAGTRRPAQPPPAPAAARRRAPGCACGGSCPRCRAAQQTARAEPAALEREADALAARSLAAGALPAVSANPPPDGGRPLPAALAARFGRDFGAPLGAVRLHAGPRAAASAAALGARAWTAGRDIVFAAGEYRPHSADGARLLAHELVHTLQQGAARPPGISAGRPGVQRKIAVHDAKGAPAAAPAGTTNESIINGYVQTLCPDFAAAGGKIGPSSASFCTKGLAASKQPQSCGCFCEMHAATDTWEITIDDNDWPHTDEAAKVVTVHSPFSGVQFGSWAKGPPAHRIDTPNWLVLGHELCGHALLMQRGTHPSGPAPSHGGRPSHDPTVAIENAIAAEHGTAAGELRGSFADPHHGESLARVSVAEFPTGSSALSALPAAQQAQLGIAEHFINSAPVKMDVIGHSDQQGAANAQNTVARARARAVRNELVSRGVDAARFTVVKGDGASQCTLPGDAPGCRKVDIFMYVFEGASETHT